jgi:hypothetical protein
VNTTGDVPGGAGERKGEALPRAPPGRAPPSHTRFYRTREHGKDARAPGVLFSWEVDPARAEHGQEIADELDPGRPASVAGRVDDDAVDERAGRLERIWSVPGRECPVQRLDPGAVDLGHVRVERRGGRRRGGDLRPQHRLPRFQRVEPGLEPRRPEPLGEGVEQVRELPLDGLQLAPLRLQPGPGFRGEAVPLGREGGDELGHEVGPHEPPPEGLADALLERRAADRGAVRAGALAGAPAAEVVPPARLEGTAAAAADHLAAEQVPGATLEPERGLAAPLARWCRLGPQARLHGLPERVVDDAQPGDGLDHDVGGVVLPAPQPAADRVLQAAPAVPDQPAGVERVAQQAVAAAGAAADRAVEPDPSTRARHALGVQGGGQGPRAAPGGVLGEDAAHDGRRGRVDLAQAPLGLAIRPHPPDRAIAVGHRARAPALPDASLQPAPGLIGEVLQEQRAHGALEPDVQLRDLALRQGDDPHPGEDGLLVEGRHVLEVAREAVQALGQDDVHPARAHRREQHLVTGPQGGRTRDRRVGEDLGHRPALALGAGAADADLVLDRGLALLVGAVAGVDGAAHQSTDSSSSSPGSRTVPSRRPCTVACSRRAASTARAWL